MGLLVGLAATLTACGGGGSDTAEDGSSTAAVQATMVYYAMPG